MRLETGEYFCPWCLHAWSPTSDLILSPGSGREREYLDDLARSFEQD